MSFKNYTQSVVAVGTHGPGQIKNNRPLIGFYKKKSII